MNVSVPALLVICGMLIAIVLVLFWHPQRSRPKTAHALIVRALAQFSAMMIGTGMGGSFTAIPTILICLSQGASAWGGL